MKKISLFIFLFFVWTCSKDSPTKSEPVPQPPTVNNLNIVTYEETPVTFTMTGSDPEGSSITFSISTEPENGTLTVSGAAGTYTPKINYHGQDTFTYIASDGTLSSKAALVTVTINPVDDEPNAMDVSGVTNEDQSVILTLRAEEYDGDNISFSIKRDPYNGTVTISGNQATYTPNENYYGSDSFTFEAMDSNARSILNTATASITINPVNDAPTMESTDGESIQFSTLELNLTGTDFDGDNLTFYVSENPLHGEIQIDSNSLIFNPNPAWHGEDSLKVQAFDGYLYSDPVSIYINYEMYFQPSPLDYFKTGYENKHSSLWLSPWKIYEDAGLQIFPTILEGHPSQYGFEESATQVDINGDGFEDVLFFKGASDDFQIDHAVEILINDQNNNFVFDNSLFLDKPTMFTPRETKIGDFNNDGKPDIFAAGHGVHSGGGGMAYIILSEEKGYRLKSFEDQLDFLFWHNFATGDVDNDGDLDVYLLANGGGDASSVLFNDGKANFTVYDVPIGSKYPVHFNGMYNSEFYDINNDGFLDVINSGGWDNPEGGRSQISIFWGDGTGNYNFDNFVSVSSKDHPCGMGDVEIYDINNDGKDEIIAVFMFIQCGDFNGLRETLRVFEHDGDFNYSDQTEKFVDSPDVGLDNSAMVWIRAQDIDNDGNVDVFHSHMIEEYNHMKIQHWEWNGTILERK